MATPSLTNGSISNSEMADVTKLTQNDNDLLDALTDGTADLSIGTLAAAGLITANGGLATGASGDDIYSVVLTNYGATSTIVGWSAFTTKEIYYKKVGKLVFVNFLLEGTSNSTDVTFTLPYAPAAAPTAYYTLGTGQNNGSRLTNPTEIVLVAGVASVTVYKDTTEAADWTASGDKTVAGQFFYFTTN